jgi:hypothetical protein
MIGLLAAAKIIPLNDWLWIGLAVCLIGYHEYAMHEAVSTARAEVAAKYDKQIAEVSAQAKAQQDALQAQLDTKAAQRNAPLEAKIDTLAKRLANAPKPQGQSSPASCNADPARVAWADSTR